MAIGWLAAIYWLAINSLLAGYQLLLAGYQLAICWHGYGLETGLTSAIYQLWVPSLGLVHPLEGTIL